jgi:serine/threonine protein kinase/tetratricopeptide (TPR) repeat protein
MIGRAPTPSCQKCGQAVPPGAVFCPNCGTQVHELTFDQPQAPASPTTSLPAVLPTVAPGTAITIGPSGIQTSLEHPSRPAVRRGDGPFHPGQQISTRYTILKLLGAGGMGAVYQAFDHELGVAVAIKVIRPAAQSDATAAKELEQRFKRELVLARQVTHKHVVRIHDLGEIDGIKYLTMPFIEGDTLAAVMHRSGRMPLARVIAIAQQVAHGLAAAHEKGVVHRDLKPENIMIERQADEPVPLNGDALIMDFGIARSVDAGATQTAAGSVIGTLEYMAPEQAQGRKVDQRADLYAFGLIVYDMLLGRQRLASSENAMAELLSRISTPPPSPRSIRPDIPAAVDDIVMRCLHPAPEARFPNTLDLVDALDHLTPDGHVRSDVHEVVITKSRPGWQLVAGAAVIVALAGTAGWVISNRTASDMPTASEVRDPVSVLVADFDNKTGDAVFDGVIEQALTLGVEGASFITSFPRRDALRAAAVIKPGGTLDEATARLVAQREGINLVLAGAIESRGSGYHVNARAVQPAGDGATLATLEIEVPGKAQLLATVGTLAGRMRAALGDTAATSEGPRSNETFTAASLEAARAYSAAQLLKDAGRNDDALEQYAEAIRLDPDMGRAYSGIASTYQNVGRIAEALKAYEAAMQRLDRMTERERFRTRGAYYLTAGKSEEALEEYSDLVKGYPGDTTGLANLAFAYAQRRGFTRALEIGRRAADLYPSHVGRRNNVALYAMYAGQFDVAIAESDAARKLNNAYVKAYVARGLAELGLGRTADAIKTFEALLGQSSVGAQSFAFAGLADVALYEGRIGDAIRYLKQGIAADEAAKNLTALAKKYVAMADALLAQGDTAGARREAQRAVAADQTTPTLLTGGLILARTGLAADANRIATRLADQVELDPQAYARLIRAELALAQKQPRVALDQVREAQKLADSWLGRVLLARAYLDLAMFPEATSEIDSAIRRSGEATAVALQDDVPTFRYFPPLHYYKGLAQAGLKSPAAAESFKTFVSIKAKGDEAGGLVADARKRLAQ